MPSKVEKALGKYAGRAIPVREGFDSKTGDTLFVDLLNPADPVYEAMKETARKQGFELRLFFHRAVVQEKENAERVTAYLEKHKPGAWRVGKEFHIG